jgi:hypothetical protein
LLGARSNQTAENEISKLLGVAINGSVAGPNATDRWKLPQEEVIGFDFFVARDIETDDLVRAAVVDLNPVSPSPSAVPSLPDLTKVDDRDRPGLAGVLI